MWIEEVMSSSYLFFQQKEANLFLILIKTKNKRPMYIFLKKQIYM